MSEQIDKMWLNNPIDIKAILLPRFVLLAFSAFH